MNRSLYLVAALVLIALAAGAVWVASGTDGDTLADGSPVTTDEAGQRAELDPADIEVLAASVPFPDDTERWWNSEHLDLDDLEGKVVLYDFWTFGCINCKRTLPHLRALHDRYADDGLVIIGVHYGEFNYEKDVDNITEAIADLDVSWPVVDDTERYVWGRFGIRAWPTQVITDREGQERYRHRGEGQYDTQEDIVRALLGVEADAPRAVVA